MVVGLVSFLCVISVINLVFLFLLFRDRLDKLIVKNPTQDLADLFSDLKIHGFGLVRVDPDSLIKRSARM